MLYVAIFFGVLYFVHLFELHHLGGTTTKIMTWAPPSRDRSFRSLKQSLTSAWRNPCRFPQHNFAVSILYDSSCLERFLRLRAFFMEHNIAQECLRGYTYDIAAFEKAKSYFPEMPLVLLLEDKTARAGGDHFYISPDFEQDSITNLADVIQHFLSTVSAERNFLGLKPQLAVWDAHLEPAQDVVDIMRWASEQINSLRIDGISLANSRALQGDLTGKTWLKFSTGLIYSKAYKNQYKQMSTGRTAPAWMMTETIHGAEDCMCEGPHLWSSEGILMSLSSAKKIVNFVTEEHITYEPDLSSRMLRTGLNWMMPCWARATRHGGFPTTFKFDMLDLLQSVGLPDSRRKSFNGSSIKTSSCDHNKTGHFAQPQTMNALVNVRHTWFERAEADEIVRPASDPTNPINLIMHKNIANINPGKGTVIPIIYPNIAPSVSDVEHLVTIIIKYMSIYRSKQVATLVRSIRMFYPGVKIIVGDDTVNRSPTEIPYSIPVWANDALTKLILLPEDCGLSEGRNILVRTVKTKFFVLLDDDFIMTRYSKLEELLGVLLFNKEVILVGGGLSKGETLKTNGQLFESYGLDATLDSFSKTATFKASTSPLDSHGCRRVDSTFNFFMAETDAIRKAPWNPKLKINEHEAFFLQIKLLGKHIVECPVVHIYHDNKHKNRKAYYENSHRLQMAAYAMPICRQFPGMHVLHSVWWSIVCVPNSLVFCKREADDPLQHAVCSRISDASSDIMSNTHKNQKSLVQRVYQPIKMAGKKLLPPMLDIAGRQVHVQARSLTFRLDVFIAIISWAGNHETRNAIRNAIGVMLTQLSSSSAFVRIDYRFFIGSVGIHDIVREEQRIFKDIVILSEASDGYDNLLSKVTAAMRWTVSQVSTKHIMKADDDVFLNLPALARLITDRNLPKTRFYGGRAIPLGYKPIRDKNHKWNLGFDVYEGEYLPSYANGPCYIVSLDVADYIGRYAELSLLYPFRLEDVFLGSILTNIDTFAQSLANETTQTPFLVLNVDTVNAKDAIHIVAFHSVRRARLSFPKLLTLTRANPDIDFHAYDFEKALLELKAIEAETSRELRELNRINNVVKISSAGKVEARLPRFVEPPRWWEKLIVLLLLCMLSIASYLACSYSWNTLQFHIKLRRQKKHIV